MLQIIKKNSKLFTKIEKKSLQYINKDNLLKYKTIKDRLDSKLNTNTKNFEIEKHEKRINSKFITESFDQIKLKRIEKFNLNILHDKFHNKKWQFDFFNNFKQIFKNEILEPNYERKKNSENNKENFEDFSYMINLEENELTDFLGKEFNYFVSKSLENKKHLKRNFQTFLEIAKKDNSEYNFIFENFSYFFQKNENFEIFRIETNNIKNYLNPNLEEKELIFSNNLLQNYFLNFKDPDSYNISRFLKNNNIFHENFFNLKIFNEQKFFVFEINIENDNCVFVKNLKNGLFFKFYFKNLLENYEIVNFGERVIFIYKIFGQNSHFYFELKNQDFFDLKIYQDEIFSLTNYMKINQEKLLENNIFGFLEKNSKIFFEENYLNFSFFGKKTFFKSNNQFLTEFNLYYISNGFIINIFSSDKNFEFQSSENFVYIKFLEDKKIYFFSLLNLLEKKKIFKFENLEEKINCLNEEEKIVDFKTKKHSLQIFILNEKKKILIIKIMNEKKNTENEKIIQDVYSFEKSNEKIYNKNILTFFTKNQFGEKNHYFYDFIMDILETNKKENFLKIENFEKNEKNYNLNIFQTKKKIRKILFIISEKEQKFDLYYQILLKKDWSIIYINKKNPGKKFCFYEISEILKTYENFQISVKIENLELFPFFFENLQNLNFIENFILHNIPLNQEIYEENYSDLKKNILPIQKILVINEIFNNETVFWRVLLNDFRKKDLLKIYYNEYNKNYDLFFINLVNFLE